MRLTSLFFTLVFAAGCAPETVAVWVTTGDRAKLLQREADVRFEADTAALPAIELEPESTYQQIVGFGASLTDASAWLMQHKLTPAQREALLRELFGRDSGGVGFSFTRVDMGASDFSRSHYSYDDVPAGRTDIPLANFSIDADRAETIPILQRAVAINPQLTVMASPWSAPAWMKTSGSLIKGTLRSDVYGAYAEYFRKFIEAFAAEGIPVHYVSIQNEPHYEPDNYPGMRLAPTARAHFIGRHLGPLLERTGSRTRILDWDHNWDQPESPLAVLADSTARRHIAGVAWHCYGGDVAAQSRVRDAHPDKDVFFTECSGGAWAPRFGDNLVWTVRNLIVGATRNWARGVLMWNLALDETHGPHTGGCGDCRGVVTINSRDGVVTRNEEYYAFAHASRFVRPGAVRIASGSPVAGVENVAFRNTDGSLVVIAVTPGRAARFAVKSGTRRFSYALPANAVATFVWR